MPISALDTDELPQVASDAKESAESIAAVAAQPTAAEVAAQTEANTKSTQQTQVIDPASGKGSLVNDMA